MERDELTFDEKVKKVVGDYPENILKFFNDMDAWLGFKNPEYSDSDVILDDDERWSIPHIEWSYYNDKIEKTIEKYDNWDWMYEINLIGSSECLSIQNRSNYMRRDDDPFMKIVEFYRSNAAEGEHTTSLRYNFDDELFTLTVPEEIRNFVQYINSIVGSE